MNLLSKNFHILRSMYLTKIRRFLEDSQFLEMDTPILKKIVGMEPYLDPFLVRSPSEDERGYLITSPEYSLKMLLSTGLEKIYEITHTFRSGEKGSPVHSPEFLMLELYAASWKENDMMNFMDEFFCYMDREFCSFDLKSIPSIRMSNETAFLTTTKRSWKREDLIGTLRDKKIPYNESDSFEDLYYLVFLNFVEPHLPGGLVYLYDYPPECSALAKIENGVAKRFEIYWDGVELANAFWELTDPTEQRERLVSEQELRGSLGKEVFPIDEDFLSCLESGIPPAMGISLGLDRILMKILKKSSLKEVSPYA